MSASMSICNSRRADRHTCIQNYRLCARISHNRRSNFTKFSVHVTCSRGSISDDNATRYVLPVLGMTLCFHVTGVILYASKPQILEIVYRVAWSQMFESIRFLPGRQIPTENNEELRGVFRDGVSRVPRKKIPL